MAIDKNVSLLARAYEDLACLFAAQPPTTRHFLEQQAGRILLALEQGRGPIRFQFPERIILEGGEALELPSIVRPRRAGGLLAYLGRTDRWHLLVRRLNGLEQSLNPGLSVCARLVRYTLARHIVHDLLPDGRTGHFRPEGQEVSFLPVEQVTVPAMLAVAGAAAGQEAFNPATQKLQIHYGTSAQRSYLPQWVASGEDDRLLSGSLAEAEAAVASLQKSVQLLQHALQLCPSLVADETYQRKRAGLLGQLNHQGPALALSYTRAIIERLRLRAGAGTLNRGLHLSLPYFDDEALALCTYPVEIIPDGRILFSPAFVVRAMHLAEVKVGADPSISTATRRRLLAQLTIIENAFNGHSSQ